MVCEYVIYGSYECLLVCYIIPFQEQYRKKNCVDVSIYYIKNPLVLDMYGDNVRYGNLTSLVG